MKSGIILSLIGGVLLSSCSVYRDGQTPDDVYYSPARQTASAAYVQTQSGRNDGKNYSNSRSSYSAYDDFATMDDRWLMMRVRNPYRWSAFDDYSYYNAFSPYSPYGGMGGFYSPYSSYGFGGYNPGWSFGLGFGSYSPWGFGSFGSGYYNNYCNWNNYYNPYYPGVIIVDPKLNPSGYTRARNFNLNSYNNFNSRVGEVRPQYNNTNRMRYSNSNNSTLNGSERRYSNGNTEYYRPSSSDRPARSYNPSYNNNSTSSPSYSPSSGSGNSGSYGGGSSGGGGGSGSRPSRR